MAQDLMQPQTFAELDRWAQRAAATDLVPKDYRGKPDNILVAVQYGIEIGLGLMQSLSAIAVINGRPTLWGDAMLALVLSKPVCEDVVEEPIIDNTGAVVGYICTARRKGRLPKVARFMIDDAKRAKLWEKKGREGQDTPWTTYPQRMLQMRARSWALRDQFADILKGVQMREEVMDYADDPPTIDHPPPSRTIGRPQQVEMAELLDQTRTDTNSFLNSLLTGVTSIDQIPTRDYLRLKNVLLQKLSRMPKKPPEETS
jgi:hypothetical protein